MPRKEKKKITEELKEIIISLSQDQNKTIKKIASELTLKRNAVSRIIRGLPTSGSNTDTVQNELNVRTTQEDQVIINIITTQNDLTQQEIADELFERTGLRQSKSTICRSLKKIKQHKKKIVVGSRRKKNRRKN